MMPFEIIEIGAVKMDGERNDEQKIIKQRPLWSIVVFIRNRSRFL